MLWLDPAPDYNAYQVRVGAEELEEYIKQGYGSVAGLAPDCVSPELTELVEYPSRPMSRSRKSPSLGWTPNCPASRTRSGLFAAPVMDNGSCTPRSRTIGTSTTDTRIRLRSCVCQRCLWYATGYPWSEELELTRTERRASAFTPRYPLPCRVARQGHAQRVLSRTSGPDDRRGGVPGGKNGGQPEDY